MCRKDAYKKCRPNALTRGFLQRTRKSASSFCMEHFKIFPFHYSDCLNNGTLSDNLPLQFLKIVIVRQFDVKIEFVAGLKKAAAGELSRLFTYREKKNNENNETCIIQMPSLSRSIIVLKL